MESRKRVLADHRKIGKKYYPPAAQYGWMEIHYVERILPEIAWMGFFVKCFGAKRGIEILGVFIEVCFFLKDWGKKPDFTLLSNYRILDLADWTEFQKHLKDKAVFLDSLDALTPFIRCYPADNPFANLLPESAILAPSTTDIHLAREVVSDLFNRRSKNALLVQSVALWIDIKVGKYHVPSDYPFRDLITIFGDFESRQGDEVSAHVRMHINGNHKVHSQQIEESWATYFWNRGKELTPLLAENVIPEVPASEKLHPVIQFGLDFERYAWGVIDDIWSKLPVDIYQSEFFEVIGALLARQCNLAVKILGNPDLWDFHAGPLFLRPMTDCYITVAWILKDRIDRARKFITYGLGQEKLQIEHLKFALDKNTTEDRAQLEEMITVKEAWLNSQHYSFLQHVDIGSWSGISTRDMATEIDCIDFYNFAYTGWNHAVHGTWNHIGRFDAWPTQEALHKHIWQPANLDHGQQLDVVVQAVKYFDKLCVLVVNEFNLDMENPSPNYWLSERLQQFVLELRELGEI